MLEAISSDADVITRTLPEADMWRARSWIAGGFILVLLGFLIFGPLGFALGVLAGWLWSLVRVRASPA